MSSIINCRYGTDYSSDNLDYESEYLPFLTKWIIKCVTSLTDGGRLIINIDSVRHQNKKGFDYRHLIYADLVNIVRKHTPQLRFLEEIIWAKQNPNNLKFAGTRGSCENPHLARDHEYILVFSKSDKSFALPNPNNLPSDANEIDWTDLGSSVWDISSDRSSHNKYPHPAKMNPKIAERLIRLYSYKDRSNIILDPFCGSGTTSYSAELLGRSHISIDINPNFCELTKKRIQEAVEEKQKAEKRAKDTSNYTLVA